MEWIGQRLLGLLFKAAFGFDPWRPFINKPSNHPREDKKNLLWIQVSPNRSVLSPSMGMDTGICRHWKHQNPVLGENRSRLTFSAKWIQSSPGLWGGSRETLHHCYQWKPLPHQRGKSSPALLVMQTSSKNPATDMRVLIPPPSKSLNNKAEN